MMKIFIVSLLFLAALVSLAQARVKCSKAHPCENGGKCDNISKKCTCPKTYFGELCQNQNECYPKCKPNFQCTIVGNSTACTQHACADIADIAIILDCSGSIIKRDFLKMLATVQVFINKFDVAQDKIRIALFAFNDRISSRRIQLKEKNTKKALLKELTKFAKEHTGGGTRTDRALKYLRTVVFKLHNGDRSTASNIGIIFTDGRSNRQKATEEEANKIKNTDINMIAIGIGNNIDVDELKLIASSDDNVILTDFEKLPKIVDELVNKTCDASTNPCASNPCKNGGKCCPYLTTYTCDCPMGYAGLDCSIRCNIWGDIVIVLDESGSISLRKFGKMVDAAMQVIKSVDIKHKKVRIAIVTFAFDVIVHFELNSFNNKLDMLFVCDLIRHKYKGGPTFTHKALKHVAEVSFTYRNGDRERYPNYVLLLTDGRSSYPWLTRKYAKALRRSDATIYAVGIGPRIKRSEIYDIASRPKRYHMLLTSFVRLHLAINRVIVRICLDLKPRPPCIECDKNCRCPPSMKCCSGCCKNTVHLLMFPLHPNEPSILVCPDCPKKYRCSSNKHCFWPASICYKGCCRTKLSLRRVRCRKCRCSKDCKYGQKCCRGLCKWPIVVEGEMRDSPCGNTTSYIRFSDEFACMGHKICKQLPVYRKCPKGYMCCRKCSHIPIYVFGYRKRMK